MRLVRLMDDLEAITAGVYTLVGDDLVASDVDVALDSRLLRECVSKTFRHVHTETYCFAVTLQEIQMRSLEDKVSHLPRIVPVALLPHPTVVIGDPNLLNDTLSGLECHPAGGLRGKERRLRCDVGC